METKSYQHSVVRLQLFCGENLRDNHPENALGKFEQTAELSQQVSFNVLTHLFAVAFFTNNMRVKVNKQLTEVMNFSKTSGINSWKTYDLSKWITFIWKSGKLLNSFFSLARKEKNLAVI